MKKPWIPKLKSSSMIASAILLFSAHLQAANLVAINSNNQIGVFDSSSSTINTSLFSTIIGDAAGESFIGIDLRPSNNTIYGITSSNKLFTLDAYTGNSTFVASLSSSIINSSKGYGIDFNPVADRTPAASLRLVSSTGDNYAINANTGAVTTATSIAGGYSGVAYANSDPSSSNAPANTQLYYLNSTSNNLGFAPSGFNNPTITERGPLGVDVLSANGFELTSNNTGYAALNYDDGLLKSGLFNINLDTGFATQTGFFIGTVNGLTAAPVPESETYALMLAGLGLIGFMLRRHSNQKIFLTNLS